MPKPIIPTVAALWLVLAALAALEHHRLHARLTGRHRAGLLPAVERVHRTPTPLTGSDVVLAQGSTYHVDAGASVEQVVTVMEKHQIRRLPVLDEHRLVGMISEADIVRHLPEHAVGSFVEDVCAPKSPSPPRKPWEGQHGPPATE